MHTNRIPFHIELNTVKIKRMGVSNISPEAANSDWTSMKKATYNLKMAPADSTLTHTSSVQRLSVPSLYQCYMSLLVALNHLWPP